MSLFKKIISSIVVLLAPGLALAQNATDQMLSSYDIFTPAAGDKSVNYLGQVFGSVGGVIHGSSGQLLGEVFKIFNNGMVILASCILIYTIVLSVINTAQDGEFMGKNKNSAWVIFRAATGIGILVPKFSGYCLVQVFVLWVTVQGIGLADKAWDRAVNHLAVEGGVLYASPTEAVSRPGFRNTYDTSLAVLKSEVCMYKVETLDQQRYRDAQEALKKNPFSPGDAAIVKAGYPIYRPVWDNAAKTVSFGYKSGQPDTQSVCGQYSWADSNETIQKNKRVGLEQIVLDLTGTAKYVVQTNVDPANKSQVILFTNRVHSGLGAATMDYENLIRPVLQKEANKGEDQWKINLKEAANKGWIVAGSYYWDLAKINNKLAETQNNYQPTTAKSFNEEELTKTGKDGKTVGAIINSMVENSDISKLTQSVQAVANLKNADEAARNLVFSDAEQAKVLAAGLHKNNLSDPKVFSDATIAGGAGALATFGGGATILASSMSPAIGMILGMFTASLATLYGCWVGFMNSAGDPIAMVQSLGSSMVGIAVTLWIVGSLMLSFFTTILSIGSSMTGMGYGIQNGLKLFIPVLIGFIGVLFVNGMVLSTYVPLIPFLIFTFAAIGWMISVLEAIVAAPLVAAAVTHPEGHDLLGKAEQAVMLLMGVFLRPVVMVIGFLAAMIMCRVALRIVNAGFSHAVDSSMITLSGWNLFGMAAVMVIYTMIVISIINLVFNAGIVKLWETIWMWVGFHQPSTAVDQALQKVETGAHGGAQAMGDSSGGLVKAGADHRAGQMERGDITEVTNKKGDKVFHEKKADGTSVI